MSADSWSFRISPSIACLGIIGLFTISGQTPFLSTALAQAKITQADKSSKEGLVDAYWLREFTPISTAAAKHDYVVRSKELRDGIARLKKLTWRGSALQKVVSEAEFEDDRSYVICVGHWYLGLSEAHENNWRDAEVYFKAAYQAVKSNKAQRAYLREPMSAGKFTDHYVGAAGNRIDIGVSYLQATIRRKHWVDARALVSDLKSYVGDLSREARFFQRNPHFLVKRALWRNAHGMFLLERGQRAEAKATLDLAHKDALGQDRDIAATISGNLGDLHFVNKEWSLAKKMYERALKEDPEGRTPAEAPIPNAVSFDRLAVEKRLKIVEGHLRKLG